MSQKTHTHPDVFATENKAKNIVRLLKERGHNAWYYKINNKWKVKYKDKKFSLSFKLTGKIWDSKRNKWVSPTDYWLKK